MEDIDIEDVSVWNGEEGTYDFVNKDTLIYVRDNVRCDSFTFSMTNDSGEYPYENSFSPTHTSCDHEPGGSFAVLQGNIIKNPLETNPEVPVVVTIQTRND